MLKSDLVNNLPLYIILPDEGGSKKIIALPRVDFPHPDSPTKPRVSPLYNLKLKDFMA